jgi:predicted nucleic acid-binding protein
MSGLLIDTDVLLDYLAGVDQAGDFLEYARDDLHLSAASIAELADAMRGDAEWEATLQALTALIIHPVDIAVARAAGALKGRSLGHRLIAATAKVHDLSLVTLDKRAYPDVPRVLVPYRRII